MRWIKKVAETPLTAVAKVIDSLAPQVNDRINAPSIAAVREATTASWDKIYPVGSVYISVNDSDPSAVFGGTWQKLKDRFLLGSGDTYQSGTTGGSATHTPGGTVTPHALTVNEIPSHTHTYLHDLYNDNIQVTKQTQSTGYDVRANWGLPEYPDTSNAGGGQAHSHGFTGTAQNTMPPYLVVNMWVRTA